MPFPVGAVPRRGPVIPVVPVVVAVVLRVRDARPELKDTVLFVVFAVGIVGLGVRIGIRVVAVIAMCSDALPLVVDVDLACQDATDEGQGQKRHDGRARHDDLDDASRGHTPVRRSHELDEHEEECHRA